MVDFETKIKSLLRASGKTHKQFCADIGITDAGMRKIYVRNSMEVSMLERIATYFNVPITDFFGIEIPVMTDVYNNVSGTNIGVKNDFNTVDRFIALLNEKDKQIDRLLTIIERK